MEHHIPLAVLQEASVLQGAVSLVVRYHIAASDDLDSVLRILLQLSAYHIEVLPLSSGKSGSVSGEVRRVSSLFLRYSKRRKSTDCAARRRGAPGKAAACHTAQPRAAVPFRGLSRHILRTWNGACSIMM